MKTRLLLLPLSIVALYLSAGPANSSGHILSSTSAFRISGKGPFLAQIAPTPIPFPTISPLPLIPSPIPTAPPVRPAPSPPVAAPAAP